jgi:hypothetical protein
MDRRTYSRFDPAGGRRFAPQWVAADEAFMPFSAQAKFSLQVSHLVI